MKTIIQFRDFDRLVYQRSFEIPALPWSPQVGSTIWLPKGISDLIYDQIWADYQILKEKYPDKTLYQLKNELGPIGPLPFLYRWGDTMADADISDFIWVVNIAYHYRGEWEQLISLSDNPFAHTTKL